MRRLKLFLGCLVVFVVVMWGVGWLVLRSCIAIPPRLPADTSIRQLKVETRDGKTWLGKSYMTHREGLLVIHVKGSPFEIGYATSALLHEQVHTLENEFLDMIHSYVPQDWKVNILKNYVIFRNRYLSSYIPEEYRLEIYAGTLGCPDVHPELGPYYNRLLNYHAAQDISYLMIDNPLISKAGCTAFGAWGKSTSQGHLITGRNFDWEAAEVFSRDRVVVMCEPDNGIPFISLSWAGMAGVVSGMNRAGVSITMNGAPSSLPGETATPIALVTRDILQKAHNLDEALAIMREAHVFVSTLCLIGSRVDGKFVVVEKTPESTQVREADGDSIICPNHFETPTLRNSQVNTNYMATATSVSREARLKELLQAEHGTIDAAVTTKILRDRDLPGGIFAGNGHRATLNAFIATHATIMDLNDSVFWAASPPNQLGKFVAFDVQDFDHEIPERSISADPVVASGEYEKAKTAHKALMDGRAALKQKDAQTALKDAETAESLNPGFYQNAFLRGRALQALGKNDEAGQAFKTALAEHPAFRQEQLDLEAYLQQVQVRN